LQFHKFISLSTIVQAFSTIPASSILHLHHLFHTIPLLLAFIAGPDLYSLEVEAVRKQMLLSTRTIPKPRIRPSALHVAGQRREISKQDAKWVDDLMNSPLENRAFLIQYFDHEERQAKRLDALLSESTQEDAQLQQLEKQTMQLNMDFQQLKEQVRQLTVLLVPIPAAIAVEAGMTTILLGTERQRNSQTSPSKYLQHLQSTKQISQEALPTPADAKDAMRIAGGLLKGAYQSKSAEKVFKAKPGPDVYEDLREAYGKEIGPIAVNALRWISS